MRILRALRQRQLRKMEAAQDSISITRVLDRTNDSVLAASAVAALGRLGDEPALSALRARLERLYITDATRARDIIGAIGTTGSTAAREVLRHIYAKPRYREHGCEFSQLAERTLVGIGDPRAIMNTIRYVLGADKLNGRLRREDVQYTCDAIRTHVDDAGVALQAQRPGSLHVGWLGL